MSKEIDLPQLLNKILIKVLDDSIYLNADVIRISPDEKNTFIDITKEGTDLKRLCLKANRFNELMDLLTKGHDGAENKKGVLNNYDIKLVSGQYSLQFKIENNDILIQSWEVKGDKYTLHKYTKDKVKNKKRPIVLILEDDFDQSKFLEMMLLDLKYEVHLATNGVEGLKLVQEFAPDLIISDIMMPQMDGAEFIEKIKKNPAYRSIPILVLTVLSDSEKEFALLNLGIDDYCQKTTPKKILLKRIENLVHRHIYGY